MLSGHVGDTRAGCLNEVRAFWLGGDCDIYRRVQEALVIHRNAPLTPTGRLRLARCVVDDGWPLRRAAERFQVSHTTAARWAGRYHRHGQAGMEDRSSRPRPQPRRTSAAVEDQVVRLRREHRIGPLRLAARCGIAASTAHRILHGTACPHWQRRTGPPANPSAATNEHQPGDLLHIDVKKLGRIPDGGGHKVLGRADGRRNKHRHRIRLPAHRA